MRLVYERLIVLRRGAAFFPALQSLGEFFLLLLFALLFFLTFVLPQFAGVLQDFGAKVDPLILTFLNFSTFLRGHSDAVLAMAAAAIGAGWLLLRRRSSDRQDTAFAGAQLRSA